MTILDEIAARTRERVAEAKRKCPDPYQVLGGREVFRRCDRPSGRHTQGAFPFEKALRKEGTGLICELKKASPSKGLIAPDFQYTQIASSYDAAGADCISCLTEPYWFLGRNEYLTAVREATDLPILRKDFTVDEYMIHEAKALGADAVLLIVSILDPFELRDDLQTAEAIGLSALVEAHDEREIETALKAGARIIGVNNRNLKDFSVDVRHAGELRAMVPEGVLFVSESGVRGRADVAAAEAMRADAVLVGEALMRADNRASKIRELRGRGPAVKICGLMTEEDARAVNAVRPDFAGLVFADTRHRVNRDQARRIREILDPAIRTVGVFVDAREEDIIPLLNEGTIDLAQLHGSETDDMIRRIREATGKKVIKAIIMDEDAPDPDAYPSADYLLFDAGRGSGRTFRWDLLAGEKRPAKPFFLAGGLNPDNVGGAAAAARPFGVDVSSGVEDSSGRKSSEAVKAFAAALRPGGLERRSELRRTER